MISAVVLTKDKKEKFAQCLKALVWCDEIVVLENDNLTDFAAQRNEGLKKAKGEWVFFVDDDEIVSPALAQEIKDKIHGDFAGFYLRRDDFFWGSKLSFGETANVRLLRLAKKNSGIWQNKVHEIWKVKGKIAELKNPLFHYPHATINEFIVSINHYTDLVEKNPFSLIETLLFPPVKFVKNYVLLFGFLDGFPGFVVAYLMSLHSLLVRIKRYDFSTNS